MTLRALDFTIDLLIADLYSGAGGSAMGLYRGFIERYPGLLIVGIDIKPQPHYPAFHDAAYAKHFHFVQGDALNPPFDLSEFDFIWASPVCKGYSSLSHMSNVPEHKKRIGEVRKRLEQVSVPYVIENVTGARRAMQPQLMLCGQMFGLKVFRHRWFESNCFLWSLPHPKHDGKTGTHRYPYSPINGYVQVTGVVGFNYKLEEAQAAMGIDWIRDDMISQAIPPAYSEYIAQQIQPYPEAR